MASNGGIVVVCALMARDVKWTGTVAVDKLIIVSLVYVTATSYCWKLIHFGKTAKFHGLPRLKLSDAKGSHRSFKYDAEISAGATLFLQI